MINAKIDPRGQISTPDEIVEKAARREWEVGVRRVGGVKELQTDVSRPARLATN